MWPYHSNRPELERVAGLLAQGDYGGALGSLGLSVYSPPYNIEPQDGQFCVVNSHTGTTEKCHPTREKALAHQRALMANVDDAALHPEFVAGGACMDNPYHLDLLSMDGEIARRALAGETVLIIPQERFYDKWGTQRDVGSDEVDEFVNNWTHRETRGIRRNKLAVDIDHNGAAVGWYKEVVRLPGLGVGARFSWTRKGQAALEEGEYAYFSPSVYWAVRDRKTGSVVRNQIGGGALTNYPYFGEATALMSWRGPRVFTTGGSSMTGEQATTPTPEEAQTVRGIARFFSFLGGTGGTTEPPTTPPVTNGGAQPVDLTEFRTELADMSTQITELSSQVATVTTERDTAQATVADLQGRLVTVEGARQAEHFTGLIASQFSHLPGDLAQLSEHLLWLYSADQPGEDGKRLHWDFFSELLQKADATFAEHFSAQGVAGGPAADALAVINTAIDTYRAENTDADYNTALQAVMQARPDLYNLYNQQREATQ